MCDDCLDNAWSEVYARDAQIERLESDLEVLKGNRDFWFEENRQAEVALDNIVVIARNLGADEIVDIYDAWLMDQDGEDD